MDGGQDLRLVDAMPQVVRLRIVDVAEVFAFVLILHIRRKKKLSEAQRDARAAADLPLRPNRIRISPGLYGRRVRIVYTAANPRTTPGRRLSTVQR